MINDGKHNMSNNQSALVRSNISRGSAVATAGAIAPRVVNALVRAITNSVAQNSGRGQPSAANWGGDQQTQGRSKRRGGRRKRGGNQQVSFAQGGATIARSVPIPNVRRLLRGMFAAVSNTSGVCAFSWVLAVQQPANIPANPMFGSSNIGTISTNFVSAFQFLKFNKVSIKFVPAVPTGGSTTFQYAMGYTKRGTIPNPIGFNGFTDYTTWTLGGFGPGTISFVPDNAHGGVIPVQQVNSDDSNEVGAGCFGFYAQLSTPQTIQTGMLYFEADVLLMDS